MISAGNKSINLINRLANPQNNQNEKLSEKAFDNSQSSYSELSVSYEKYVYKNRNFRTSLFGKAFVATLDELTLHKSRMTLWKMCPVLFQARLDYLSLIANSSLQNKVLLPPSIIPDSELSFNSFEIDLKNGKKLYVYANLYNGEWSYPIAKIDKSKFVVMNNDDILNLQIFFERYNIKAKKSVGLVSRELAGQL